MSAVATVERWRRSPVSHGPGGALQAGLLALAALAVFVGTYLGFGLMLGGAALAAAAGLVIWRWPMLGMLALVVLGMVHQFFVVLLFHFTESPLLVKAAQVWKELVVVVLLAWVLHLACQRRTAPKLHLLDLGVLIFLGYGAFYLLYLSSVDESTLLTKALGLRADAFFLLAYFIGRGFPLDTRQLRLLLVSFTAMAFVVTFVAMLQFAMPEATNAVFERLSFAQYMELQRGDRAVSTAMRENEIYGVIIPRAGSLLLSDLALAFFTLLAVPLAAALFFTLGRPHEKLVFNLLLLASMTTTVLTVTRSAIIAIVPCLALVALRSRAVLPLSVVAAQVGIALLLATYALGITPTLLLDVFSPDEASALGHITAVEESLETLRREPFGRGLGTAGQIAQRFAKQGGITNESWYLQLATEIGVIGAGIFVLIVLAFAVVAFIQYGRVRDRWLKGLCLGMGGAIVGFSLVSLTLHAWEGLTTSIIFWLFAGLVVRAPSIEHGREGEGDANAHRRLA